MQRGRSEVQCQSERDPRRLKRLKRLKTERPEFESVQSIYCLGLSNITSLFCIWQSESRGGMPAASDMRCHNLECARFHLPKVWQVLEHQISGDCFGCCHSITHCGAGSNKFWPAGCHDQVCRHKSFSETTGSRFDSTVMLLSGLELDPRLDRIWIWADRRYDQG